MAAKLLEDLQENDDLAVQEAKPKIKEPPMYKVLLINDDYTPMDFVVLVLTRIFGHSEERATKIMLEVHHSGQGVCGIYTRDIAETKVFSVNNFARTNDHPLLCTMEQAPDG